MASEPEPVAWMWEEMVDPDEKVVVGGTVTRFATHWSTGPKDAVPLYTAAALLAAEQRGRDAERERCAKIADAHDLSIMSSTAADVVAMKIAAAIRKGE